jgi:integrase
VKCMEERLACLDLWEGGDYFFVFNAWNGKPLNPYSVKTWWTRFTKRHSLRYINFHALRHTSATLLLNQGLHAKIIQARLGHANITTTLNIYTHALQEADQGAAKIFDNMLQENKKNRA